jgi:CubicO group peptidase (beta-lactamase class C family)
VGSRLASLTFTDPQHDAGWTHVVVSAAPVGELPSATRDLDVDVVGAGRSRALEEWVAETSSTSLVVLDEGTVVHEWYADGLDPGTRFLGASMTKSVLAHLVGRAVGAAGFDTRVLLGLTAGVAPASTADAVDSLRAAGVAVS